MSITDIENRVITKPWKGNSNGSLVVLIPKKIAEKTHISRNSYVTIQGADDGDEITIKRLILDQKVVDKG